MRPHRRRAAVGIDWKDMRRTAFSNGRQIAGIIGKTKIMNLGSRVSAL